MRGCIRAATQSALKRDVFTPDSITAKVHDGIVTLEGQVKWNFEREAAERTVQYLKGVVSVKNAIMLEPPTSESQVKAKIHAALQLQATTDTNSIQIDTSGGKVTLTGYASSWQSIEAAVNAARAIPGVTAVVDQVKMNLSWQSIEAAANAAGAAIPLKVSEKLIATDLRIPLQKGTVCGDEICSRATLV